MPKVYANVLTFASTSGMLLGMNLNTADGLFDHLSTLPTKNLEEIASRPVFNAESARMVAAAGSIVDMRRTLEMS